MKIITLAGAALAMLFSAATFADKVVITGSPVVLEQKGDVYYVPDTYTATTDYNYVTIGGTNQVCYLQQQPNLASLSSKVVNVEVGGKQVQWTCYAYDETYFTVSP
ncbi:hypothetical protein Lbir_0688 [Legionella birminghamensis]|uniref:Secreted protein n=1 Tax=Legionella birminghamensis TaxID=28083 RepID=A0A378I8A9_9GAMM|nr:hypothetical protein [Legionella birminghamensis]KTC74655.1 hypothetical protein Lbir_0688 [Legionella birminghamensis]STX31458.1 Uncharacterised protein [Legionella birminghamensis]